MASVIDLQPRPRVNRFLLAAAIILGLMRTEKNLVCSSFSKASLVIDGPLLLAGSRENMPKGAHIGEQ